MLIEEANFNSLWCFIFTFAQIHLGGYTSIPPLQLQLISKTCIAKLLISLKKYLSKSKTYTFLNPFCRKIILYYFSSTPECEKNFATQVCDKVWQNIDTASVSKKKTSIRFRFVYVLRDEVLLRYFNKITCLIIDSTWDYRWSTLSHASKNIVNFWQGSLKFVGGVTIIIALIWIWRSLTVFVYRSNWCILRPSFLSFVAILRITNSIIVIVSLTLTKVWQIFFIIDRRSEINNC